jgi:hypothetical protein
LLLGISREAPFVHFSPVVTSRAEMPRQQAGAPSCSFAFFYQY